ncbi:J domain-containing protein [Gluconobacter morbifer]|uniref:J domain-containing protein n=1 Tax=Gluconobacter morbifer G707 TaxID=1088869 RepID=G6XJ72_9PROT|nr:J domain-containing protein [Gluconobacter morbifer]EHH68188.1 hypothetical protein GMO_15380 [Gluconobacter morbifer G707]
MKILAIIGALFLAYWGLTHIGLLLVIIWAFMKVFLVVLGALAFVALVAWLSMRARRTVSNAPFQAPFQPASPNRTWYEVLRVNESASPEEIRAAYIDRLQEYHPDKVGAMGDRLRRLALEETQAINTAFQQARILKNF